MKIFIDLLSRLNNRSNVSFSYDITRRSQKSLIDTLLLSGLSKQGRLPLLTGFSILAITCAGTPRILWLRKHILPVYLYSSQLRNGWFPLLDRPANRIKFFTVLFMIFASMSCIPNRFNNLIKSVPVLARQCDTLFLMINQAKKYPKFLDRISNVVVDASLTNRGSSSRFIMTTQVDGYYLTVDDDILYPDDYVKKMIEHLDRYQRRAMVCVYGAMISPTTIPIMSAYKDAPFTSELKQDMQVMMPGCGTACFHTSSFQIVQDEFAGYNISDVSVMVKAAKEKLPIYIVKREKGWLKKLPEHCRALRNDVARRLVFDKSVKANQKVLGEVYDTINTQFPNWREDIRAARLL